MELRPFFRTTFPVAPLESLIEEVQVLARFAKGVGPMLVDATPGERAVHFATLKRIVKWEAKRQKQELRNLEQRKRK